MTVNKNSRLKTKESENDMDIGYKAVLVTGCAGFIGSKISELLLKNNVNVIGVDNINDYYSQDLKEYRLSWLQKLQTLNSIK